MPLFCPIKRCISSYIDGSLHKHHVQIFFTTINDLEIGYKIYQASSFYRRYHIRFLVAVHIKNSDSKNDFIVSMLQTVPVQGIIKAAESLPELPGTKTKMAEGLPGLWGY